MRASTLVLLQKPAKKIWAQNLKWGCLKWRLIQGLQDVGLFVKRVTGKEIMKAGRQMLKQSSAAAGDSVMERAFWFSMQPERDHFMQKHLGWLTFQTALIRSAKHVPLHLRISDNLLKWDYATWHKLQGVCKSGEVILYYFPLSPSFPLKTMLWRNRSHCFICFCLLTMDINHCPRM